MGAVVEVRIGLWHYYENFCICRGPSNLLFVFSKAFVTAYELLSNAWSNFGFESCWILRILCLKMLEYLVIFNGMLWYSLTRFKGRILFALSTEINARTVTSGDLIAYLIVSGSSGCNLDRVSQPYGQIALYVRDLYFLSIGLGWQPHISGKLGGSALLLEDLINHRLQVIKI